MGARIHCVHWIRAVGFKPTRIESGPVWDCPGTRGRRSGSETGPESSKRGWLRVRLEGFATSLRAESSDSSPVVETGPESSNPSSLDSKLSSRGPGSEPDAKASKRGSRARNGRGLELGNSTRGSKARAFERNRAIRAPLCTRGTCAGRMRTLQG